MAATAGGDVVHGRNQVLEGHGGDDDVPREGARPSAGVLADDFADAGVLRRDFDGPVAVQDFSAHPFYFRGGGLP